MKDWRRSKLADPTECIIVPGPPPFLDRVSVGIDHRQVTGARE